MKLSLAQHLFSTIIADDRLRAVPFLSMYTLFYKLYFTRSVFSKAQRREFFEALRKSMTRHKLAVHLAVASVQILFLIVFMFPFPDGHLISIRNWSPFVACSFIVITGGLLWAWGPLRISYVQGVPPTRAFLLSRRRCPSCTYNLAGLTPDPADGCTVCPECSAAWKLPPSAENTATALS